MSSMIETAAAKVLDQARRQCSPMLSLDLQSALDSLDIALTLVRDTRLQQRLKKYADAVSRGGRFADDEMRFTPGGHIEFARNNGEDGAWVCVEVWISNDAAGDYSPTE